MTFIVCIPVMLNFSQSVRGHFATLDEIGICLELFAIGCIRSSDEADLEFLC